jgi:hypothetical protein
MTEERKDKRVGGMTKEGRKDKSTCHYGRVENPRAIQVLRGNTGIARYQSWGWVGLSSSARVNPIIPAIISTRKADW